MLTARIDTDLNAAMRARDAVRLATLRMLKSAIEYAKIEKQQDQLSDADVIVVIKKQVKQREDSIAAFQQGGRADLVDKEKAEMAVLKSYLPEELPREQVEQIVRTVIAELGASTRADMGRVMKAVQVKLAGRAENRLVSQIVSAHLA
jgi:uncharacterized protein YqeY